MVVVRESSEKMRIVIRLYEQCMAIRLDVMTSNMHVRVYKWMEEQLSTMTCCYYSILWKLPFPGEDGLGSLGVRLVDFEADPVDAHIIMKYIL